MVVQSGDNAIVALVKVYAEHSRAFCKLVNEHVQMLGMQQTSYHKPEGFVALEHTATADDLMIKKIDSRGCV